MKNATLIRIGSKYPNLKLETKEESNGIYLMDAPFVLVSIFNLSGKLELINKLNFGENSFIDLTNFNTGEYIAVFESIFGMITYKMNVNKLAA